MNKIDIITDSPFQSMILRLDNGDNLTFTLRYSYNQMGWFYDFVYGSVTVNNRRVVSSLNMLRALKDVVPFGLACIVADLYEPVAVDDFKSGRAGIYTLSPAEVLTVEGIVTSV